MPEGTREQVIAEIVIALMELTDDGLTAADAAVADLIAEGERRDLQMPEGLERFVASCASACATYFEEEA